MEIWVTMIATDHYGFDFDSRLCLVRTFASIHKTLFLFEITDKRNTGPAQTPDWTPEMIDEYARQQGRAQDWARRSKLGEFVKDPSETSELAPSLRFYGLFNALFFGFSYGRATPTFLADVLHVGTISSAKGLQGILQIPALSLALASVGSCVVCFAFLAPERNRNAFRWGLKGFFGGPLAVIQLRQLDALITREELESQNADQ